MLASITIELDVVLFQHGAWLLLIFAIPLIKKTITTIVGLLRHTLISPPPERPSLPPPVLTPERYQIVDSRFFDRDTALTVLLAERVVELGEGGALVRVRTVSKAELLKFAPQVSLPHKRACAALIEAYALAA